MDFVPQPEAAKKFGSIKWLKWNMYRYPQYFIMSCFAPILIYDLIKLPITYTKRLNNGTYVPDVIKNRYAICRSDDWPAQNTPSRYKN